MPELPEVETIRLGLSKKISGLEIIEIEISSNKSFVGKTEDIKGKKVKSLWRRGKVLGIELEDSKQSKVILIHLKMTGQLIWRAGGKDQQKDSLVGGHPTQDMVGEMPNRSTRVIFTFSDRSKLYFNDQRKFGWVKVSTSKELKDNILLDKMGPEPLDDGFTWQILQERLNRHKNMPIKVAIMDQTIVAGVGNIYAVEACFDAKIDPRKRVNELKENDFKKLHQGIVKSLKDGIKHGGSTRTHFVNSEGKKGSFLDYAYVYGREGDICKICGNPLKKISLGGRGTVFCPICQK